VKKLTALERTTKEGEALLKVINTYTCVCYIISIMTHMLYLQELGYKDDGEDQGRRRTRSGAKPPAPSTPPPAKKEKKALKSSSAGMFHSFVSFLVDHCLMPVLFVLVASGRRGRPPKKAADKEEEAVDAKEEKEEPEAKEETPAAEEKKDAEAANEKETNNHTAENSDSEPAKE